MNIRCFFGHKWEYSIIDRNVEYNIPGSKKLSIKITDNFRLCRRCYKKQIAMNTPFSYNKIAGWRDDELSKDELRDKKLKELGI
jgi:hypothetical protein